MKIYIKLRHTPDLNRFCRRQLLMYQHRGKRIHEKGNCLHILILVVVAHPQFSLTNHNKNSI